MGIGFPHVVRAVPHGQPVQDSDMCPRRDPAAPEQPPCAPGTREPAAPAPRRPAPSQVADHEDLEVRASAAHDRHTPPEAVHRLTHDPDPAVRAAPARHPHLPPTRLAELLDDEELAHHAAANPTLEPGLLHELVESGGQRAK
ncbi:hypothetical protein [Streptomyces melanogenes]|uniref:hypothetical protein n=1 Tax=Streptomyces melanogenes TaxID=67326 RepID=UPI0037A696F4